MINFPGPEKILLLAIIALVVLGPSRIPSAARTAGKWVAELRKLTSRFQEEVSGALGDPKDAFTSAVGDLTKEVGGWRNEVAGIGRTLTSAVVGTAAPEPGDPAPTVVSSPAPVAVSSPAPWTGPTTAAAGAAIPPTIPSPGSMAGRPGLPSLPPVPDDPSLN